MRKETVKKWTTITRRRNHKRHLRNRNDGCLKIFDEKKMNSLRGRKGISKLKK